MPLCLVICLMWGQGLMFSAEWVFLWDDKSRFPLPASTAVAAGGAERGSGPCRGGVSCCWGDSSSLGKLAWCPERCWEAGRWKPSDWWSCTKIRTGIQKSCPGPNPEGSVLSYYLHKHEIHPNLALNTHKQSDAKEALNPRSHAMIVCLSFINVYHVCHHAGMRWLIVFPVGASKANF